jgi:hypothetical protein
LYCADKYLLPLVPLIILFLARGFGEKYKYDWGRKRRRQSGRCVYPTLFILLAILLANGIYLGVSAFRQVDNNVRYLKGDRYAGYDAKTRAMFEELETIYIPKGAEVFCRKPEFLYYLRGIPSKYPWSDKEAK